jgi:flagellar hook-basal body complex protein FliE
MADDLTIQQLRSLMEKPLTARAAEIKPADPAVARPDANPPVEGPSFADTLKESIAEINNLQLQADENMADLATGKNANVQETILAVEKADISFKLMMEVRNKIISAYQEVMRTQV